ncbi:hypothetical protein K443DRAFT_327483 [Laccaria amethystina LaAM-08-1]|uniref:F-box domain-containing protein n=1 Tax=Laccaria amethystina LaAM-08-1 TaxID=1095629 RepID=A0A0C9X164_9AGAR|nr:hypothetical protein K443DRAFT_327483 [Laccaria amethystina LaAM-08-1]
MFLQDLPSDLLTYLIQTSIDPIDIISLRKTCRALYTASHSRTVWRSALHRTCHTHRLFAPTFPIDSMSARHLESAALSPWRFSALMDSSPANTLSPARTRVFDPYGGVLVDEDEDDCSEIVLVPGGRFLLTEHGGLSLWDLGLNTEGTRKMTTTMPIAVHASEDASKLSILGVVPAPDCRGLRVIVANGSMSISVSEIHPAVPKPQFQFIRRLRLKASLHLHAISGDRVVLLDEEMHIYVWNLISNIAVTWKLAGLDPAYDIIIFGDHLLILRHTGISVLPIPTTPCPSPCPSPAPCPNITAALIQTQPPTEITHPFNNPNSRRPPPLLAAPAGWWPPSLNHIYLGLATPVGRNLAMSLYKLEMEHLGLTGSDAKEPFKFAMDIEKVYSGANGSSAGRRAPFYARVALPPMTLCDGQLSQSWALSGEVLTSLMRMEGEEEEEEEEEEGEEEEDVGSEDGSEDGSETGSDSGGQMWSGGGQGEGCSAVTKSLYTYRLQDRVLYDFCPASGRLVVATRGEIRVLDFLVPVLDSA